MSGCSCKILMIDFFSSGKRYTLSAVTGSVIMVAGLELIRVTFIPSSLNDLEAWDPA